MKLRRKHSDKVQVQHRALLARLNRKLASDYIIIRRTRPDAHAARELGLYYVIDTNRNAVIGKDIDLEEWGREKKVLREYEELVKE